MKESTKHVYKLYFIYLFNTEIESFFKLCVHSYYAKQGGGEWYQSLQEVTMW